MTRQGHRGAEEPATGEPPRVLQGPGRRPRAGKGGSAHSRDTAADTVMRSGAQRRAAEAGWWRVRATSGWTALCAGKGDGERVQDRGAKKMNATYGGQ